MKKSKLIYIYPKYSTFVKRDIDFLSEWFDVVSPKTKWTNKTRTLLNFVTQLFYLMKNIPSSKAVIIMFGGYWAFIPTFLCKLFGKPSFIIIGGTDAVSFPYLGYGNLRNNPLKTCIKWSYSLATCLIPVHEALIKSDYSYDKRAFYSEQGVKAFFPTLKTPFQVIHNGFDSTFFTFEENQKKTNHFISIASINEDRTFQLKGIDLIVNSASNFPDAIFTIIGISNQFKNQLFNIPANVRIIGFLAQSELINYLQESEFYLQLSISEGFPNALAEAMLCGCIPIVSNVASLPEIIGNTGYILKNRDINQFDTLQKEVATLSIEEKKQLATKARHRIEQEFPLIKRIDQFKLLLSNYIKS